MSYWVSDACIAVHTALALDKPLRRFWERLAREQVTPCAPRLWISETSSAIRSLLTGEVITEEEAGQALRTIHSLRVGITHFSRQHLNSKDKK